MSPGVAPALSAPPVSVTLGGPTPQTLVLVDPRPSVAAAVVDLGGITTQVLGAALVACCPDLARMLAVRPYDADRDAARLGDDVVDALHRHSVPRSDVLSAGSTAYARCVRTIRAHDAVLEEVAAAVGFSGAGVESGIVSS